jgi:hypothetical protein
MLDFWIFGFFLDSDTTREFDTTRKKKAHMNTLFGIEPMQVNNYDLKVCYECYKKKTILRALSRGLLLRDSLIKVLGNLALPRSLHFLTLMLHLKIRIYLNTHFRKT